MRDGIDDCEGCGAQAWLTLADRAGNGYARCSICNHYVQMLPNFVNARTAFDNVQRVYYDEGSLCLSPLFRRLQERIASKRLQAVQRFLSKGSILEVGPGSGHFLAIAHEAGFRVTGVEHSPVLASSLRKELDVPVVVGSFEDLALEEMSFDAYVSFHVIEHVTDALEHLRKAYAVVKPGGYAFIATPSTDSWEHALSGLSSPNFSSGHVRLFSRRSIGRIMADSGWEVVSISTPAGAISWIRVLTAALRKSRGNENAHGRGEYMKSGGAFTARIVSLLEVVGAPILAVQRFLRGGNELFVVAKRR